MKNINWSDFEKVELRMGTITRVEEFPEARYPAFKIWVDFGPDIGIKKSSARITSLYQIKELINKQVLAVVNFPPKQIGPFLSECLITGFPDAQGQVVLATCDKPVPDGAKLF